MDLSGQQSKREYHWNMPWKDQYGFEWATIEEGISLEPTEAMYPAPSLPQIPTMGKKLIVESCIPGWQPPRWYSERGIHNLPPLTVEDQAQAIADCVKAGAAIIHTHPRDPNDPTEFGKVKIYAPKLLAEIHDRAFDMVGDFVTMTHAWVWDLDKSPYIDYISDAEELLEVGKGNKYVQGSVIMTWGILHYGQPEHGGQPYIDGMKWLEAHDVKPIYQMHMSRFMGIKRTLFDSGVSKWKPYVINIHTGKHLDEQIDFDPWGRIETIKNIHMLRQFEPGSINGVYAGGRNWLPVTVEGIMEGVDIVRAGIEDQYWLWPHRDDISTYASQTTELVVTIAKALGKEIATPAETREICGMKLTSADWKK
jgi:uncharacterized protein (DUF849 family)